MKFPDEYNRKHVLLRTYTNKAARYTPSLTNGQWVFLGLIADMGWLLNLSFTVIYLVLNGFHAEIPALLTFNILDLAAVVGVQVGYGFDIYTSIIDEKAQQTKRQKNIGFGLPAVASLFAVVFGVPQAVCSALFLSGGVIFSAVAAVGAAVSFVCCLIIFRSFRKVEEK